MHTGGSSCKQSHIPHHVQYVSVELIQTLLSTECGDSPQRNRDRAEETLCIFKMTSHWVLYGYHSPCGYSITNLTDIDKW